MTDENYQGVGDNGVGGSLGTGDSWTAAMLTEIEKRIDDELKKFKAAINGDGVISGLAVSEKGAGANQSVDVALGLCLIDDTEYTEASTVNVALDAAHGTYARWDIITYDSSAGNPSKVTGTEGAIPTIPDVPSGDIILALVLRAANDNVVSDAEITDKRIFAHPWLAKEITASDTLRHSNDAEKVRTGQTAYGKMKEIKLKFGGTYRIGFVLKCNSDVQTAYGKIYKNGGAVGTEQSQSGQTWSAEKLEDLAFDAEDLLQLYGKTSVGGGVACHVKNLRLDGDMSYKDFINQDP